MVFCETYLANPAACALTAAALDFALSKLLGLGAVHRTKIWFAVDLFLTGASAAWMLAAAGAPVVTAAAWAWFVDLCGAAALVFLATARPAILTPNPAAPLLLAIEDGEARTFAGSLLRRATNDDSDDHDDQGGAGMSRMLGRLRGFPGLVVRGPAVSRSTVRTAALAVVCVQSWLWVRLALEWMRAPNHCFIDGMMDVATPFGAFSTGSVVVMYMNLAPFIARLPLKMPRVASVLVKTALVYL